MLVGDLVLNDGYFITGGMGGVAPDDEDARHLYWMVQADWKDSDDNCLVSEVAG